MNDIIGPKQKAISLREEGKSYGEINKILGIAKSTLSTWLKDLPISKKVKTQNINKAKFVWADNIKRFNQLRSEKYQKETQLLIKNFSLEVSSLSNRDLFFIGLALFWAEGGKREKWNVRFVNSDPMIIRSIMRFFREVCNVADEKFTLNMHIYPNIEENEAKGFWSKVTNLPLTQFRKSQNQISKSSKFKRPVDRLSYGTLHINIGDANLNKKIKGWILGLSQQINK